MSRKRRIQNAGYHYVSNRGVEFRDVFIVNEDYNKFLSLISSLSNFYHFTIHSYSLQPHSYHLIIETSTDNISYIMRLLNVQYTKYFNKKYYRSGHLWEGRFKSCYISNKDYIFYFIRYIEQISILTGRSSKLEFCSYSSYRQFIGLDKWFPFLEQSIIFQKFNSIQEIKSFFLISTNKEEINKIIYLLQQKIIDKKQNNNIDSLDKYFNSNQTTKEKNKNILKAYQDGFSQHKIAKTLGVSQQAICKKIKILNQSTVS